MVAETLVESSIATGELLTQSLEKVKFPFVASFWLYTEESARWRLVIASPLVESLGPLKAYERVQEVLHLNPELRALSLSDISVVSSKDPLVRDLRLVLGPAKDVRGVRLGGTRVNDHLVDGAYLYRLKRPSTASTPLKVRRSGKLRVQA